MRSLLPSAVRVDDGGVRRGHQLAGAAVRAGADAVAVAVPGGGAAAAIRASESAGAARGAGCGLCGWRIDGGWEWGKAAGGDGSQDPATGVCAGFEHVR